MPKIIRQRGTEAWATLCQILGDFISMPGRLRRNPHAKAARYLKGPARTAMFKNASALREGGLRNNVEGKRHQGPFDAAAYALGHLWSPHSGQACVTLPPLTG